jgi:hypothetical protein
MHKLELRNLELETSSLLYKLLSVSYLPITIYPFLVSIGCGQQVHKLVINLRIALAVVHSTYCKSTAAVDKRHLQAALFAQARQFLYTAYQHIYTTFKSVNFSFVHIIHSPYIYDYNTNKGVY